MARRIERLTLDNLGDLPGTCQRCVFWELAPVRRAQVRAHECEEKAAWVSTVLREWGSCGRIAYVDDQYAGHLLWAPPVMVPGADGFATAPVSSDAVLLVTGYVDPAQRDGGLGRVLIQHMAKDLLRRGDIRAVEAFGDSRGREGHCVLPADFLLGVGFFTHRAHASYPRMRMDLRTTLTWREEFEVALGKLLAPVKRPVRHPKPAPSRRAPHGAG